MTIGCLFESFIIACAVLIGAIVLIGIILSIPDLDNDDLRVIAWVTVGLLSLTYLIALYRC
jgi:hypothetical protein